MSVQSDPYAEGADAALSGKSQASNPYDPDEEEEEYWEWISGFEVEDAKED